MTDDVFLCAMRRTPVGRHGGALALARPDDMAALVIDSLLDLHPGLAVDEVIFGCANHAGEDNRNVARMAVLLSRLPETVPAPTLNRHCALALDAAWHAADVLPVTIPGRKSDTVVAVEEHPQTTTLEKLAALPAPFRAGGSVAAGNAAGVKDGASARAWRWN